MPAADELIAAALEAAHIVARAGEAADPVEPAPRPMRPFVRFAKLPDRALAVARRTLDDDEAFRHRVRDAVSEDLVGRASWLYLDRPEGWESEVDALAGAAADAEAAAGAAREEAVAARRLEALEARLRTAEVAVATASAEREAARSGQATERRGRAKADSEVGRLRKRVADLEARVARLNERLAAASVVEGRAHTLEARVAELETELSRVRAPVEPELASVTSSVEAATAAASTLVESLEAATRQLAALAGPSPAPPPSPPPPPGGGDRGSRGRARRRPAPLPPAVMDDTVEAAAHLLRLRDVLVLVDGYNVTKRNRGDRPLIEQRQWLLDSLVGLAARTGAEAHVVFDGSGEASAPAGLPRRARVQARFTSGGVPADDVLLEMVDATPLGRPVVVATSDRAVLDGSRDRGANVMTAEQLVALLRH